MAAAIAFVAVYFIIAQLLPLLMLAWASLLPYLQTPSMAALESVSLRNFLNLPKELLWRAGTNTAILMVVVPTVTLTASVAISWVVLRTRIKGRALFDFMAFLPLAIPAIVCGAGFGLFQVPNNRNLFLSAPAARSAAAGGMQGTARLAGQTLGAVVITVLLASETIEYAARFGLAFAAIAVTAAGIASLARVPAAKPQAASSASSP